MPLSRISPWLLCLAVLWAGTVQAAPQTTAELEDRLDKVERLLESQSLLQMYQHIEALQQTVQELRGELEQNTHTLEGIQRRQRDLYLDIDRRLRPLEVAGQGVPSAPPVTQAAPPLAPPAVLVQPATPAAVSTATPTPSRAQQAQAEDADYRKAFNLLKEGSYAEAAEAFRALLDSYPNGSYSDNAQYWLGEVHYVTRNFEAALVEFQKVLDQYPASLKVPDAMLKLGYIHYELKHWKASRDMLETLVSRHAQSRAARLAQQRLQRMQEEGH